jgi:ABC-type multidrug transport system ATPase subunit
MIGRPSSEPKHDRVVSRLSDPTLTVVGLCKGYGALPAVVDLTFTAGRGEVVGLLGRNGAGKTTALSCIAGLLRPDRGSIFICGYDVDGTGMRRIARRHVRLSTQRLALYPYLSTKANLEFYCALAGVSKSRVSPYVSMVATRFGLNELLDRSVRELSVGEQRLVHVAASVLGEAPLLLLDEPTAGLDVLARATVIAAVKELADEGASVLYSSHYIGEIEALCDRILILREGTVVVSGSVSEILSKYGSQLVEIVLDDETVIRQEGGVDKALAGVDTATIRAVNVASPSLETVFLSVSAEDKDGRMHDDWKD